MTLPKPYVTEADADLIAEIDRHEADHGGQQANEAFQPLMARMTALPPRDPLGANCRTDYKARHHSGTRPLSVIDLVVLHSTEGATAEAAARWFAHPDSQGSAHICVDDNVCYRTLADNQIPWAAPGANFHGFHIEQAGRAAWPTSTWSRLHDRTLRRAAYKTALHCKRYGIKVRWLNASSLKLGVRNGITDHDECSKAFGGSHWDPGAGWPRTIFMAYVRLYFVDITVKRLA